MINKLIQKMEQKENNIYPQFVKKVFGYFNGLKTNQGLFLYRTLLARRNTYTADEYKLVIFTIVNLVSNGFLIVEDSGFVRLTQNGYDYLQDGQMPYNKINLENLINTTDNWETQFDTLWLIIGKENQALFYVSGPVFYNTIKPYLSFLHKDYMKELSDNAQPTSRIKWYRKLYGQLDKPTIVLFLHDLSMAIERYYIGCTNNDDSDEFDFLGNAISLNQTNSLNSEDKTIKKKTVFITYCWETDIDKNHKNWVHKLAKDLEPYFNVVIDIKQPLGIELNQFMEQTIKDSDEVLIIATPEYKRRADNRVYGVGYETSLITNDLVNNQNKIKFIPIIKRGSKEESYPLYLGNRKGLNMTDDVSYDSNLKELIENLQNY